MGSLDSLGDAAQPCVSRAGRVREDGDRRAARRPDAHRARQRGERHGRWLPAHERPRNWTMIPVPPIVTRRRSRSPARLVEDVHFATRNTQELTLLQGLLVCRECGYACYRGATAQATSGSATTGARPGRLAAPRAASDAPAARSAQMSSTRSSGQKSDDCSSEPELVRAEIDRRLAEHSRPTPPPAAARRSARTDPGRACDHATH